MHVKYNFFIITIDHVIIINCSIILYLLLQQSISKKSKIIVINILNYDI